MDIFEKISNLCKRRGFVYQGSEIYGGIAGMWDFGPLGVELKRNIKNLYWREMVESRDDVVGIDAAIIMPERVWQASGHVESFSDPLVDCKKCKHRFRADHIIPEVALKNGTYKLEDYKCPDCGGDFTEPRNFNLLVETYLGVVENNKQKAYLRGEITQGVHVNFKQVIDSTRVKIPFGIAQIGKAFRNEITPGGFIHRCREFEQMELQFYVKPDEKESMKWFEYWKEKRMNWYAGLGYKKERLRFKEHAPEERAHYARAAFDIEYLAEGDDWREMEGIHHRGNWDLSRHTEWSTKDLRYFDEETKERFIPFVIETSAGVDRATLYALINGYEEEKLEKGDERIVLKLHPKLAPYKAAIFPLLANKPKLVEKARSIYTSIREKTMVAWDDRGNIGKRYRYQDEIGTPYCVTIDFETLDNDTVTMRNRDTMTQERIKIVEVLPFLEEKLK